MLAVTLATLGACALHAQDTSSVPEVTGVGTADVLVKPSSAVVLVSLAGEAQDGPAAAAALEALVEQVNRALKNRAERVLPYGAAFGEKPGGRGGFPDPTVARGTRDFMARAGIAVEVRDPNAVPALITTLAKAGIESIHAVVYLPDQGDPAWQRGVAHATELALANARRVAQAAGGDVGALVRINMPVGFGMPGLMRQYSTGYGPTVALQPSELMTRVSVQGTWEFRARGQK